MQTADPEKLSKFGNLRSVIDDKDGKGFKNRLIDQMHWEVLKRHLVRSTELLDFGCGIGRMASRIASMSIRYTGIDISAGMVEKAKEINKGDAFTFVHFDGTHIPFPDCSFDTVVSLWVFMAMGKPQDNHLILSEIRRVLRPGGRLIMLEQASISGNKSGYAKQVSTEEDFNLALSGSFDIRNLYKVRSPSFSRISKRFIEGKAGGELMFRAFLSPLAKYEIRRALKAPDSHFSRVPYYDFLLEAVLKPK